MTLREELLSEIEDFLARSGMAPGTFGTHVAQDGKFVKRLRAGADVRTQMFERVRGFIREHEEKQESA